MENMNCRCLRHLSSTRRSDVCTIGCSSCCWQLICSSKQRFTILDSWGTERIWLLLLVLAFSWIHRGKSGVWRVQEKNNYLNQSSLDPAPQSQFWQECFYYTLRKLPQPHDQSWLKSPGTSVHSLGQTLTGFSFECFFTRLQRTSVC